MRFCKSPKLILTALLLGFYSSLSFGQETSDSLKKANLAFSENRFEDASKLYKAFLKAEPKNAEANYYCGLSLFKSGYKASSLPYFKATYKLNPNFDKYLLKYLGRAYQLNYEFDTAIAVFKEYETHLHKHERSKQGLEKDVIDKRILECMTAKELIRNPKHVKIANMGEGVNSKYDDYSPAISADERELMFTSRRDSEDGNDFSRKDYAYYEEVFISERQDSLWTSARSLSDNVNGKRHDACVAVSPDGHKLIVYKSNHITKGDLYYSDFKNGEWTEPVKFGGEINSSFFEPSATINSAENWLIFSSDRPGGFGGLDLYMSKLLPNGKWAKPENLGPAINTKYDEDAPFLQTDQRTLHFSSSGHNSIGGYDIFTTYYDAFANKWSTPENLGHPINTPDDDIYFSWNNDGSRAYFSSVRDEGFGGQDLYTLEMPKVSPPVVILKGNVTDARTKQPLGSLIKITIYHVDSNHVVGLFNSNNLTGKYVLALPHNSKYGMQVEAEGYVLHSDQLIAPKTFDFVEMIHNIELQPIESGTSVMVLKNIFFDYNRSELKPESNMELKAVSDFLMSYPDLKMEIGGHTDSIGSVAYNLKLSEARALAVKSYLLNAGVPKERIRHRGYGFSKPIASNQTPEGRQQNRRTEFFILENKEKATADPAQK